MSEEQPAVHVNRKASVALLRSQSASLLPRVHSMHDKGAGTTMDEKLVEGTEVETKRAALAEVRGPQSLAGVRLRPMTAPDKGMLDRFETERKRAEEIQDTLSKSMSQMSLKVGSWTVSSFVRGADSVVRSRNTLLAYLHFRLLSATKFYTPCTHCHL